MVVDVTARTIHIPVGQRYTLIDASDVELVRDLSWHEVNGYAVHSYRIGARKDNQVKKIWMHRLILGLESYRKGGLEVDHINGNRLDNRRSNLRVVTRAQNLQNRRHGYGSSSYRGVHLRKNGRWLAQGSVKGKKHHIGVFDTELEAAAAARIWRISHVGPHAA